MFNIFKKTTDVEVESKNGEALDGPAALLKLLVEKLVDNPGDVKVQEVEGDRSTILELRVNEDDIGKVIGKKGRIIKSLRIVVRAAAIHEGKNVSIELVD